MVTCRGQQSNLVGDPGAEERQQPAESASGCTLQPQADDPDFPLPLLLASPLPLRLSCTSEAPAAAAAASSQLPRKLASSLGMRQSFRAEQRRAKQRGGFAASCRATLTWVEQDCKRDGAGVLDSLSGGDSMNGNSGVKKTIHVKILTIGCTELLYLYNSGGARASLTEHDG